MKQQYDTQVVRRIALCICTRVKISGSSTSTRCYPDTSCQVRPQAVGYPKAANENGKVEHMKKSESESVIRRLCHSWAQEHYPNGFPNNNPSFIEFHAWLSNTHPIYLTFRTATNVKDIVEMWFDQEFKQTWRN
jgi:hypothetical protein